MVTWTSAPNERFRFTSDISEVTWYASSEWISWGFCNHFGKSLPYRATNEGHPKSPKTYRTYVAVVSLLDELDQQPGAYEKAGWFPVQEASEDRGETCRKPERRVG